MTYIRESDAHGSEGRAFVARGPEFVNSFFGIDALPRPTGALFAIDPKRRRGFRLNP